MPFLGKQPTAGFASIVKDDLTADGSTTAFTLSKQVANANDIAVFVGNVRQEPTDAYTVNGTTLTMSAAPASGINFYVLHIAGTVESSVIPADNTISTAKLQNDSVTGAKIENNPTIAGNLTVSGTTTNTGLITAAAGIAIGGTGSVNTLDDYEEGTFTPTMYGSTGGTPVNGSGWYTKIGNIVKTTIAFSNVNMSTGGHSGTLRVGGLPFASASQNEVAAVPFTYNVAITGTDKYNIGYVSDNSTIVTYYRVRDLNTWTGTPVPTGSSVYVYSTFTYTTSA